MSRQLWPVALVVCAALAHVAGSPSLTFYLLLAAIPVIGAAALACYGEVVGGEGGSAARTALWTLALAVVVATVALPTLGGAALVVCLLLVGVQGIAALTAEVWEGLAKYRLCRQAALLAPRSASSVAPVSHSIRALPASLPGNEQRTLATSAIPPNPPRTEAE